MGASSLREAEITGFHASQGSRPKGLVSTRGLAFHRKAAEGGRARATTRRHWPDQCAPQVMLRFQEQVVACRLLPVAAKATSGVRNRRLDVRLPLVRHFTAISPAPG